MGKRFKRFLQIWIVIFSAAVIYSQIANHQRINDIQRSRVNSCELTYQAFEKVFKPFIPPIKQQHGKEKKNVATFHKTVKNLVNSCMVQTSTK